VQQAVSREGREQISGTMASTTGGCRSNGTKGAVVVVDTIMTERNRIDWTRILSTLSDEQFELEISKERGRRRLQIVSADTNLVVGTTSSIAATTAGGTSTASSTVRQQQEQEEQQQPAPTSNDEQPRKETPDERQTRLKAEARAYASYALGSSGSSPAHTHASTTTATKTKKTQAKRKSLSSSSAPCTDNTRCALTTSTKEKKKKNAPTKNPKSKNNGKALAATTIAAPTKKQKSNNKGKVSATTTIATVSASVSVSVTPAITTATTGRTTADQIIAAAATAAVQQNKNKKKRKRSNPAKSSAESAATNATAASVHVAASYQVGGVTIIGQGQPLNGDHYEQQQPIKDKPRGSASDATLQKREDTWNALYEQALAYKAQHGHLCVPSTRDTIPQKQLYRWLCKQRYDWTDYRNKQQGLHNDNDNNNNDSQEPTLTAEATTTATKTKENSDINQAPTSTETTSTPTPTPTPTTPAKKRSTRLNTITEHKITLLAQLGLGSLKLGPSKPQGSLQRGCETWEIHFQQLLKYKKEFGTVEIRTYNYKKHKDQPYYKLSTWCETQRCAFFKRTAIANNKEVNKSNRLVLTDHQMQKLVAIGFRFTNKQSSWEERIEQIINYKAKHGDTLVPVAFTGSNNLGRWVTSVKRTYSLQKLSTERISILDAIGFDFSIRKIHRLDTNTNDAF